MFDCLDLALDAFDTIYADGKSEGKSRQAARLAQWLTDDAMHAIDDLVLRPDFRTQVRWSLENLATSSTSPARKLVKKVDSAIVAHARDLLKVAEDDGFRRRLFNLRSPLGTPASNLAPERASGWGTINFIAQRPWEDMVSHQDFWSPSAGLNLRRGMRIIENPVEFAPIFCNALREPGDHVSGMLLRRVDYWVTTLNRFRAHWQNAAPSSGPPEGWEAVVKSDHLLRQSEQALHLSVTVGPAARLRQACVALVQAYAEFCPSAEFSWLNGSAPPHVGRGVLKYWLTRHDQTIIAARIAGALTDASAIYRCRLSSEEVVQEAARSNALVLAQGLGTRLFYWRKQQVQGPWENYALWETLWALGLRAKQMQSVDHSDFGENSKNEWVVEPHGLTSRVDRLKDYLPEELRLRVKGLRGSGLYRLDLPANEIYMANIFDDGVFEVGGSPTYLEVRAMSQIAGLR